MKQKLHSIRDQRRVVQIKLSHFYFFSQLLVNWPLLIWQSERVLVAFAVVER